MSFNFRIRDFAYPAALLRLHTEFARNEHRPPDELEQYQLARLRAVATHAAQHIPYYKKLFRSRDFNPEQLVRLEDLRVLPLLSKDGVRIAGGELHADDAARLHAHPITTSGSTGAPLQLLVDKGADVLEFTYYRRIWGWAGYTLGARFAELSAEYFAVHRKRLRARVHHHERLTRRLMLNSLLLSSAALPDYLKALERFRPRFLKGLPSNLHVLALLCSGQKRRPSFEAVFSQGENLYPHQRRLIEEVFSTRVFDSYGQLERVAAISQCPYGSYHIHSDYGLVELLGVDRQAGIELQPGSRLAEIVGSSLHNHAMPLLRYRTHDLVEIGENAAACRCGRTLPIVKRIIGRDSDAIITPDGRAVTALYLVFDLIPGLMIAQVEQPSLDTLIVRYACEQQNQELVERGLRDGLSRFVGTGMRVELQRRASDELRGDKAAKFKPVISHVPLARLNAG